MEQTLNFILNTLRSYDHKAYLVGGCVRDTLLGNVPKDYDICTDATPLTVQALFPGSNLVGAHFGVVIVKHEGSTVEVATFRSDGQYSDGRRPESVQYVDSPYEDSKRRDFTINALYSEDFVCTKVLDFHGGLEDLRTKTIRTVGNPFARFSEDYLRILRAVRFATRYGFKIAPETQEVMTILAPKVAEIATERVMEELSKILRYDG